MPCEGCWIRRIMLRIACNRGSWFPWPPIIACGLSRRTFSGSVEGLSRSQFFGFDDLVSEYMNHRFLLHQLRQASLAENGLKDHAGYGHVPLIPRLSFLLTEALLFQKILLLQSKG